jgi:hypothetical protein
VIDHIVKTLGQFLALDNYTSTYLSAPTQSKSQFLRLDLTAVCIGGHIALHPKQRRLLLQNSYISLNSSVVAVIFSDVPGRAQEHSEGACSLWVVSCRGAVE